MNKSLNTLWIYIIFSLQLFSSPIKESKPILSELSSLSSDSSSTNIQTNSKDGSSILKSSVKLSNISLSIDPQDAEVYINDKRVDIDTLKNKLFVAGKYTISASHKNYASILKEDVYFPPGSKLNLHIGMNRKNLKSLLVNYAIPGLRQIKDDYLSEGILVATAFVGAASYLGSEVIAYNRAYQDFNKIQHTYLNTKDEAEAQKLGILTAQKYSDLKHLNQKTGIALGIFVGIFLYHIVDVMEYHYEGYHTIESISSDISSTLPRADINKNYDITMNFRFKF